MNTVALIGRLGGNPELKSTPSGVSVMSFSLAVSRPKVKDTTDWINCVAWRHNAEYLAKYAGKGNKVGITGVLTARKFEGSDGKMVTAYEVVCDNVELLDNRSAAMNDKTPTEKPKTAETAAEKAEDVLEGVELLTEDEDLPF